MSALALAVFGVLLIAAAWAYTLERVRSQRAEAVSSEFSKNANLALALDVHTNQLLKGIDQFVILMKNQYEGSAKKIPIKQLITPVMASPPFNFIGVTNERGDVLEAIQDFAPTNVADREMFKVHQQRDSKVL